MGVNRSQAGGAASARPSRGTKRSAVLLSVMVPGLGQLVQRRWLAAAFFFWSFMVMLIGLIVIVARVLVLNFSAALRFAEDAAADAEFHALPIGWIVVLFVVSLAVYAWSIVDAFQGQCRSSAADAGPPAPSDGRHGTGT